MPRHMFRPFLIALIIAIVVYVFKDVENVKASPDERFLLLTAHPDDECMFFGPTVLALSFQTEALFSLTVSNGNNDGIGLSREPELRSSLAILGIPSERSFLLNHPSVFILTWRPLLFTLDYSLLQDNFTETWDARVIAEAISPYIVSQKISTILTFDRHGVSSHPNHYSLYFGAQYLLASAPVGKRRLRAYALVTDPVLLKYSGWTTSLSKLLVPRISSNESIHSSGLPTLQFWSGLPSYVIAVRAMYQHRSQLIWFRWLYVLSSRYMWHNKWIEIEPGIGAR
ncbi:N-acetylglucosaminyl-phosphatidylinositol de-N-acetylase [Serendipita sp. 401]|nr:N-acetylglucosaminyl-phosphatidylinositol de-N-acetylase [Serendipita sp. 401]